MKVPNSFDILKNLKELIVSGFKLFRYKETQLLSAYNTCGTFRSFCAHLFLGVDVPEFTKCCDSNNESQDSVQHSGYFSVLF